MDTIPAPKETRTPLVSIILPVYNAGEELKQAVSSVLKNTVDDWEIIIINDGSTDNTGEVGRKLAASDPKIRYFEQENGGPALARNTAMEKARGKYIMFLDADDEFLPDMIEKMVTAAEENGAEVVMCATLEVDSNGNARTIPHGMPANKILEGEETVDAFLRSLVRECRGRTPALWNKLYSSDFLRRNKLRFETWQFHGEDWTFNLNLFASEVPRMYFIEDALYKYKYKSDSISRNYVRPDKDHPFHSIDILLKYNDKYHLGEEGYIYERYVRETMEDMVMVIKNENKQSREEILRAYLSQPRTKAILKESLPYSFAKKTDLFRKILLHGGYNFAVAFLRIIS